MAETLLYPSCSWEVEYNSSTSDNLCIGLSLFFIFPLKRTPHSVPHTVFSVCKFIRESEFYLDDAPMTYTSWYLFLNSDYLGSAWFCAQDQWLQKLTRQDAAHPSRVYYLVRGTDAHINRRMPHTETNEAREKDGEHGEYHHLSTLSNKSFSWYQGLGVP